MNNQIIPTLTSASNDNQSNISTQQDYTYRMIKEIKQLKVKAFTKPKKNKQSELFYLTNFHTNNLRDTLHQNKRYQNILSSEPNRKNLILKKLVLNGDKERQNKKRTLTISSIGDDKDNKELQALTETKIENAKSGNYYFSIYSTTRNETLSQFVDISRKIRLQKMFNFISQDAYYKYENYKTNELDLMDLNIYNYSTSFNYLKKFAVYSDSYFHYLEKKLDYETNKNNALKERRIVLINEIQKIRKRLHKMQALCENNCQNKFFLLCVKNNTNQVNLFCEEDKKEYESDQEKIKNLTHLNVVEKQSKDGAKIKLQPRDYLLKLALRKRASQISEGDMVISYVNQPKTSTYKIFNSADEFKDNLNKISTKVANLLNVYNEREEELRILRDELEEKRKELQNQADEQHFWDEEIKEKEKQLSAAKLKYLELSSYSKNLPKVTSVGYKVVFNKIIEMYKNINAIYPIRRTPPLKKFTPISCIEDIEITINTLLILKNNYKKNNPQKYNESKREIDKRNKMKQTQYLIMKEKERIKNKVLQVINKNKKIIVLPRHKVSESYQVKRKKAQNTKIIKKSENEYQSVMDELNDIFC